MKIGLVIYGSLDTISGGYTYDRRLVAALRGFGEDVSIISVPWRGYFSALADNLAFRLPSGLDLLIQDELTHPSMLAANRRPHPYPIVSLIHHLRASEVAPAWQKYLHQALERRYLRSVDAYIYNSRTTEKAVRALIREAKPELCAYPPTDRFKSELTRAFIADRAMQPGPLRVLFLGNLIPRKGLHTLLKALALLPEGSTTLEVVGSLTFDAHYTRKIRKSIGRLSPKLQVRLRGYLNDESLQEVMREAQVLVVPSSYEGFGIVYAEGMGFGLPAIGTNVGGACEVIRHAENGFLVNPGEPYEISTYLANLEKERDLLTRVSLNALESYQHLPAWQQTAENIHAFLKGRVG